MPTLVRIALFFRRLGRAIVPFVLIFALAGIFVLDAARSQSRWLMGLVFSATIALFVYRIRKRFHRGRTVKVDAEVGVLLVLMAFAVVLQLDRNLDGVSFPLIYATVAVIGAFAAIPSTVISILFALALEVVLRAVAWRDVAIGRVVMHALFLISFAGINALMMRFEIDRLVKASRMRFESELTKLREAARSYRLLSAPSSSRMLQGGEDERLARSGVEEIQQSLLFALRVLRESLGLHTAALFWKSESDSHLRISELVTSSTFISEGPFSPKEGIFGAVFTQKSPVLLDELKPSFKLPYYSEKCPVQSIGAVPVYEHGFIRGVLVVDRADNRPFTQREVALLEETARYAVRTIENERIFVQLDRAKAVQGKLYRAAETLGASMTESDVIRAGMKAAREIASVDFAAITLFDESTKMHEIRAVSGETSTHIVGLKFRHNNGLVSMVLENKHPLPYRGNYDDKQQIVFTKRIAPPVMPSIIVLPLVVHDQALGTLVLGSHQRNAFHDSVRHTLEVLASHMGVSLSHARMVKRLEDLATMDGLSGLLNRRAMMDAAQQKLIAANRFHRKLSLIIVDIDYFKKVNDTHGHDVGDIVIKGLADLLKRVKRTTDAVARFGGEEFVVLCEETDANGALLLAERIREELQKMTFMPHAKGHKQHGIQVTCSIGIATFPDVGMTWEDLFKSADEALYTSKRSGRNRTTVANVSAAA